MATEKTRQDTRGQILGAAVSLVRREGVSGLTIERVAGEAGLSKGGVFYHFPSKEALIEGMIGRALEDADREIGRLASSEAGVPGGFARAYARATFGKQGDPYLDVGGGLLAAVANDPGLLEPLRARYGVWQERLARDGIDPATATLVRLAADGLWFADLFGFAPPKGRLRKELLAALLSLTDKTRDGRWRAPLKERPR
jgi:AcrR family transcriptional regulator